MPNTELITNYLTAADTAAQESHRKIEEALKTMEEAHAWRDMGAWLIDAAIVETVTK